MGALSDPRVGEYFAANYVAYYERIGSFTIVSGDSAGITGLDGGNLKLGGNVGSFFCDRNGWVIHGVTGPVAADVLLTEAYWARENYDPNMSAERMARALRMAHRDALSDSSDQRVWHGANVYNIHHYLAMNPLVSVERFSAEVFTQLLHEPVDGGETPLFQIDRMIAQFREQRLPFVIAVRGGNEVGMNWGTFSGFEQPQVVGAPSLLLISADELRGLEERQGWVEHDLPEPGQARCIFFGPRGQETRTFITASDLETIKAAITTGRAQPYNAQNSPLEKAWERW